MTFFRLWKKSYFLGIFKFQYSQKKIIFRFTLILACTFVYWVCTWYYKLHWEILISEIFVTFLALKKNHIFSKFPYLQQSYCPNQPKLGMGAYSLSGRLMLKTVSKIQIFLIFIFLDLEKKRISSKLTKTPYLQQSFCFIQPIFCMQLVGVWCCKQF